MTCNIMLSNIFQIGALNQQQLIIQKFHLNKISKTSFHKKMIYFTWLTPVRWPKEISATALKIGNQY